MIKQFICNKSTAKKSIRKPPEPLTTSTLQQLASNELHLSPKETMKLAQQLYEAGHITYMRTDSKKYSKEFIEKIKKYIVGTYNEQYVSQTIDTLASKIEADNTSTSTTTTATAEAHEAIRPVSIIAKSELSPDLPQKAIKLYELIRNTTIESCMPSAQYSTITATITINKENINVNK